MRHLEIDSHIEEVQIYLKWMDCVLLENVLCGTPFVTILNWRRAG